MDMPQCMFFQETKFNNQDHFRTTRRHFTNHVGYKQYQLFVSDKRTTLHSSRANRRKGVAIFFHASMPGFADLKVMWALRVVGRYLVVRTTWGTTPVYFHNVYAPVKDHKRAAFFAGLPREFEADSMHVIGGDFNFPMDASLDASTYLATNNLGKPECLEWLAALRVVDAWRTRYPDEKVLSGPGGRNRLDYLFVDHSLVAHYHRESHFASNKYRGDHLVHTTTLAIADTSARAPVKRVWRLPRELLQDPRNVHAVQVEAERLLAELDADPTCNAGAKWCGWLRRMKGRLRQSQFNRQRHRADTLQLLRRKWLKAKAEAKAGRIDAAVAATAGSMYESAQVESDQARLDAGFDRHANASEVATAFFLRKPPAMKVPITSATLDGVTSSDPARVADIFTRHWRRIMVRPADARPPDPAIVDDVIGHVTAALSPEQAADLDRPLDADELCAAMKTMKPSKAPGPDGWPAAFFQVAPTTFASILVRVFDYQRSARACLLAHQRQSVVTLLYKKGDRSDPGNYRPIALMPVEVKILTRALARRLSDVAPTLIHPSQSGFVKGRSITDLIHLVTALQHKATREDREWCATFLDYAKAYDMVSWSFLFDVMAKMNIGPVFTAWVRLLYKKPQVHLLLDGALGPAIRPTRGVKQGCPLSCLLFDLYLEPLGAMLRACPDAGIRLDCGSVLTGAFFADDSTVLSGSMESAEHQVGVIVGRFCEASGASLNRDKCVTLALNENEGPEARADRRGAPSIRFASPGTPIRFLGVYVGQKLVPGYTAQLVHDKYLAAFTHWACRARTIQGRRVLASTAILSTVWYVTAVTPIPDAMVATWQRALNHYVIGRMTDVSAKYQAPIAKMWFHDKQLGLGIPHIASSVRAQRLRLLQRLMQSVTSDEPPPWTGLVLEQFQHCLGTVHRASHPFDFLSYSPQIASAWLQLEALQPLWLDVWRAWSSVPAKDRMPVAPDLATTLSMPVWLTTYHEFTRPSARTVSSVVSRLPDARHWCQYGVGNGLHCLRDLLVNTGSRFRGYWPDFARFQSAMATGYRGNRVELQRGQIRLQLVHYTRNVHSHLTAVYDAVRARLGIRLDACLADVPSAPHPFRAVVKEHLAPFELWPRRLLVKMARHGPIPTEPHPTATPSRTGHDAARVYMNKVRESARLLTPVHADVWFRAAMHMLPVNARYSYLRDTDPGMVWCSHGCASDETIQHVLHGCVKTAPLWALHTAAWQCFGVGFGWFHLSNLDRFSVNGRGAPHKTALFQLWVMLSGVALHLLWMRRNDAKHRSQSMPPAHVLLDITFVTWMTTVRRWMRLQDLDDPVLSSTRAALAILLRQPHYHDLSDKYPRCLELDTVFDVH